MAFRLDASMRCSICAAFGLVLVFVWSALSDHTFNLRAALPESLITNPRAFFLLGILVLSVALAVKPNIPRTVDAVLGILLPFVGSVGTACIALAPHQSLFPPSMLCLTGLIALGAGYCWFVMSYGLLLARSGSVARIVYCLAAALTMEPFVRVSIESILEHTMQAGVAIALPFVAMALLIYVREGVERECAAQPDPDTGAADWRSMDREEMVRHFAPLISIALLLATVRSLSPIGTWDAKFDPVPMTSSPGLLVLYTVCVILFARFALVKFEHKSDFARLQPPFLLIALTLLASLILISNRGPQSSILYTVMVMDDSFAHMLFWAEIAYVVASASAPACRIAGLALAVYASTSIAWLFLLGDEDTLQAPVMIAAIVAIYLLTMAISQMSIGFKTHSRKTTANDGEDAVGTADAGEDAPLEDPITAGIKKRCLDISSEYKLSPRETEVFMLLAQGRTRAYIQDELLLAENTVKTHISHIYKKLDVSNRQEMFDLVFTPLQSDKDE